MTSKFITNQGQLLSEVINNILPSADQVSFLVGYFYFSGFQEIYKNLIDKKVDVLVGLDVQKSMSNAVMEIHQIQKTVFVSRQKIREDYISSLIQVCNETDIFDSKEKQEAWYVFLDKIKNGSLSIRKTLHPNHAKLYLFRNREEFNQGGMFPGTVITGSSNLSYPGLTGQHEINVISREAYDFETSKDIFNELWKDAVPIADAEQGDEFFKAVTQKIWIGTTPEPYHMFIRVLDELFPEYKGDLLRLPYQVSRGKFINLKYQEDAIRKGLDVIRRHNGAIIADVVGLGKSIIASCIAHNLGLQTIVIAPPHLKSQWEEYRLLFEFHARVYSSGKIEKAIEDIQGDEEKLILIDEAHKYRNEETQDYARLHKLCQGNKVLLLSATPFNNAPQDIFSLIKLFQIPGKSTIRTVENLSIAFTQLVAEYKKLKSSQKTPEEQGEPTRLRIRAISEKIRNILLPLVVRRSRLDLQEIEEYRKDLEKQKILFPKIHPPKTLEYDLGNIQNRYISTLRIIAPEDPEQGFVGARYKPTEYVKDFKKYRQRIAEDMGVTENLLKQSQRNLAKFIRHLLVRRFESSVAAFQSTLDSIIRSSENIKKYYEHGMVPVYKKGNIPDLDSLMEAEGDDAMEFAEEIDIEQLLEKHVEKGLWFIPSSEIKKEFGEIMEKDIHLLEKIRDEWFPSGRIESDPKLAYFMKYLRTELSKPSESNEPKKKIVVFSEFADTVNYLYKELKNDFRILKYTASDATDERKKCLRENFDAGLPEEKQRDDFDILIATDAISEGFNLHRAGIVFNYDIPFNPTRVIQRVGRINRINKKVFDELCIYNFFPTETGEKETRTKQISTLKIALFNALFGADTKILTNDEELEPFLQSQFQSAFGEQEELSPETKYEAIIRQIRNYKPEILKKARDLPKRSRIRRTVKKLREGVLVFARKGKEYSTQLIPLGADPEILSLADALALFDASASEKGVEVSDAFYNLYDQIKDNLFVYKKTIPLPKAKRDTIDKLHILLDILPNKRNYLEDLMHVIKSLDALPERHQKSIREIDAKNLETDFQLFEEQVPHAYLQKILAMEKQIAEEGETLILSEELI